jgi:hypothetical protein
MRGCIQGYSRETSDENFVICNPKYTFSFPKARMANKAFIWKNKHLSTSIDCKMIIYKTCIRQAMNAMPKQVQKHQYPRDDYELTIVYYTISDESA